MRTDAPRSILAGRVPDDDPEVRMPARLVLFGCTAALAALAGVLFGLWLLAGRILAQIEGVTGW